MQQSLHPGTGAHASRFRKPCRRARRLLISGVFFMNPGMPARAANLRRSLAALLLSVLAVWRLPAALGLAQGSQLFAASALSVPLAGGLYLLFRHALASRDRRLNRTAAAVGLIFSAFTLAGIPLETAGTYAAFSWGGLLSWLGTWLLFGVVFGAALLLCYQGALALMRRAPRQGPEPRISRLLGSWPAVFILLLLCWTPVWLAFWPGSFSPDSATQFYSYIDWQHSTHHPLLHTLLLGSLMSVGIDLSPDGAATWGLALYNLVQMALTAGMLAYACHWLRKRGAPFVARAAVTLLFALFPFYAVWSFYAQKDVLFGALALMFVLQLCDVWREGPAALRRPWRIAAFVLLAVLMALMRNNGIYALCLLLPFGLALAKGMRLRAAGLLAGCVAAFLAANAALVWGTEATVPCKIEMLPIPLQQIARTLRDDPAAIALDTQGVLSALYDGSPADVYTPDIADAVKWAANYDSVDESLPALLSLWVRMGIAYPKPYAEAFLVQNLPYYLPGAPMRNRFDLGVSQMDYYEIQEQSFLPGLRQALLDYDQSLSLFGLPGVRLLSDTAFFVWLCIAGLGLALYRRQRHWAVGFVFLLALWATCLAGPVAIIRYMLGFFYAMPVLLAAMLAPQGDAASPLPTAAGETLPAPLSEG